MKRRIFLVLLLMSVAASAWAQDTATQVPPDRITLEEFKTLRAENKIFVLDVRLGVTTKIKGAAYIPLDQLEARLSELPTDREIVTYCS
jgi:rhodanese-related sulfurtransferase